MGIHITPFEWKIYRVFTQNKKRPKTALGEAFKRRVHCDSVEVKTYKVADVLGIAYEKLFHLV